ncbi:hypothetical protein EAG14_11600 [Acidovorax sp. 1608163]|nr:hypothetical protein EAG14_11600 [Acidovorax sp. 1608163]
MFCTIYRLRTQGHRIHPDHIHETAVDGWLFVGRAFPGAPPETYAWLKAQPCVKYPKGPDLIPELRHARVEKVERGGMMLAGLEHDYSVGRSTRQAWWVVPKAAPTPQESP